VILSDIRRYLELRGQASLGDLSLHFASEPDAMRGMLEQWIRRGKVRKVQANASCGSGCTQCAPTTTEIYQWLGNEPTRPPPAPIEFCRK